MKPQITLTATIVADPKLFISEGKKTMASLRLAHTPRTLDKATQQWVDGTTSWFGGTAFGKLAENIGASLKKGDRVVVSGVLSHRNFNNRDGVEVLSPEITIDAIGASLEFATVQINRNAKVESAPVASAPVSVADASGDPWETSSEDVPF